MPQQAEEKKKELKSATSQVEAILGRPLAQTTQPKRIMAEPSILPSREIGLVGADPVGALVEGLPALGAGLGAGAGGIPGAAVGGAGGRTLQRMIEAGTGTGKEVPQTAGEAILDVTGEGAFQGALQALFVGGGKLLRWGAKKLGQTTPVREAIQYFGEKLYGPGATPRNFGKWFTGEYDKILSSAGAAKREVVSAFPTSVPAKSRETLGVLDAEISKLQKGIVEGRLSKELGGKSEALLEILQKRRTAISNKLATGDIRALDTARTDFFKSAQEVDPGEAQRISRRLAEAAHKDIVNALEGAGMSAQRKAYETTSTRFRELANQAEQVPQLAKVLGPERGAPETVAKTLATVPEETIAAIKVIRDAEPLALRKTRRAIFEEVASTGRLPKMRDDVVDAVFGEQSAKVKEFADIVRKGTNQDTLLRRLSVPIPGTGGFFGFFGSPKGELHISSRELAAVIDSPAGYQVVKDLFQTPVTAPQAANLTRFFMALLNVVQTLDKAEEPEKKKTIARTQ